MSRPIRVAILGASGYGAGELLRLLVAHDAVEVVAVTSTSQVGEPIGRVHPHLRGFYDSTSCGMAKRSAAMPLSVSSQVDFERLLGAEHAVVFSSLPHGASGMALDRLLNESDKSTRAVRLKAIDLSGDFRLSDASLHQQHYPESPVLPERRAEFVYGMAELNRQQIGAARYVANPGCLATAAILAGAPLIKPEILGAVVADVKTGSSGSGRQLKETTHHPTRHADFRAYKPLAHQHEPEILQAWGDPHGERIALSFVPQSMATSRGIFATVHVTLPGPAATAELRERYDRFYAGCPFVRIVDDSPTLQDVVGSNFCDISLACRGRQVIVMAALDNLVKGMAGAAIQNMNLMCGLPETSGLWTPSLRPV